MANGDVYDAAIGHWFDPSGALFKSPAYGWYAGDYFQIPAGITVVYPLLVSSNFYGLARNFQGNNVPYGEEVTPVLQEMSILAYEFDN
jgi:hypothetical protein